MIIEDGGDRLFCPDKYETDTLGRAWPLANALLRTTPSLVHDLRLVSWYATDTGNLYALVEDGTAQQTLRWRGKGYASVVFEQGDHVDVVLTSDKVSYVNTKTGVSGTAFETLELWPTINYIGSIEEDAADRRFKKDHEQSLLFKTGERHERSVAAALNGVGHEIIAPPHKAKVDIYRHIGYKRNRKPDLRCGRCTVRFEVKSFLREPVLTRVSDSERRPWRQENSLQDFHAFTRGSVMRFAANSALSAAWKSGARSAGSYDYYWTFGAGTVALLDLADVACDVLRVAQKKA